MARRVSGPLPHIKTVRRGLRTYEYFRTGRLVDGRELLNRLPSRNDPAFARAYAGMLAGRTARANVVVLPTMAALIDLYERDPRYTKRSQSTQKTYGIYLRRIASEMGEAPVDQVERRDVRALLDKMTDRPGAANMALGVLRNLFALALSKDWIETSPCDGVEEMEGSGAEHEPWPLPLLEDALTDPEVQLPVALLYYTAQRIGDVCRMRWNDIRHGSLYVRQDKTGNELDIRLHAHLAAILDATPKEALTILPGKRGRPIHHETVRRRLQKWAAARGHKIVPHGLRKNAVIALLEAGCSTAQTAAISGQSLGMVEHYAKRRNNRKLASAAVLQWQGTDGGRGNRAENK